MYSILPNVKPKFTAKGVSRRYILKQLHHKEYNERNRVDYCHLQQSSITEVANKNKRTAVGRTGGRVDGRARCYGGRSERQTSSECTDVYFCTGTHA